MKFQTFNIDLNTSDFVIDNGPRIENLRFILYTIPGSLASTRQCFVANENAEHQAR